MALRVLPDAEAEFEAAVMWFEEQQQGLGSDFKTEIEKAFRRIEENPDAFSKLETYRSKKNVRRFIVERFTFLVIYVLTPGEPVVIAITHGRRRPNYWKSRLSEL
jgi:toxin ParE1/3/4